MRFYPTPMIRFYLRYASVFIFVIVPAYTTWACVTDPTGGIGYGMFFVMLLVGGCLIMNVFWEKMFASLEVGNGAVTWRCPFRKKQVISLCECVYSGVELEESHNGLPYPFLYVARKPYPTEYRNRINKVKTKDGFIKFWYSEDLCKCLERKLPKGTAGSLTAYRIRTK